jgi:ion channel-forming bestrophin family protein
MIKYNPKEWFSLIFEFHKSDTLRKLIYIIVLYGFYTAAIVYIELHYNELKSTIAIHSLIGFVLGLLLVFRTNTAYDRWWEGRKLLGALVNTSRNLALKINTFLPEKETDKRKLFSQLISNYCFSMKNHLRDKKIISELDLNSGLTEKELNNKNHLPNYIAQKIYSETKSMYDQKIISDNIYITLDDQVKQFTDIIGGCERIKKTPIPYSYNIFLKKFIFIYTMTLPLGLATTFEYWAIPISIFILYILASLELLAEEIEDPFGEDTNDLPVDEICKTIKKNTVEILVKDSTN